MSYTPPTIEEIIARVKTYVKSELDELSPTDNNSMVYSIVVAMALLSDDTNKQIALDVIPNCFPQTATTEEAMTVFANMKRIPKNESSASSGLVTIQGTVGIPIPAGTSFVANDITFTTQSYAEIIEDTVSVQSLSINGTTATVITDNIHNFASGVTITMDGSAHEELNGDFKCVVNGLRQFTYEIQSSLVSTETSGITASANIASLPVLAGTTGSVSNLYNGDTMSIVTEISGVETTAYVQYSNVSGGVDIEALSDWHKRIIERFKNPITYFNKSQIETLVKSIAGNTKVWVLPITPDVGQVTVYFIRGNDEDIIPDATEIKNVKDLLDSQRNAKDDEDDIFVYAPTKHPINFTFSSITPNSTSMQNAIKASLNQLFADGVDLATNLTELTYNTAIKNTFDLTTNLALSDFTLDTPTADVTISDGELPTLGTVQFL